MFYIHGRPITTGMPVVIACQHIDIAIVSVCPSVHQSVRDKLANDTTYHHSYNGRRIGNRTQAFEWYQFQ